MATPEARDGTFDLGFKTFTPVEKMRKAVDSCIEESAAAKWPQAAQEYLAQRLTTLLAVVDFQCHGRWKNLRDQDALIILQDLAEKSGVKLALTSNDPAKRRTLFTGIIKDLQNIYGIRTAVFPKSLFTTALFVLQEEKSPTEIKKIRDTAHRGRTPPEPRRRRR